MNFPQRNPTPKISFYWPVHFYLINKKMSMDHIYWSVPFISGTDRQEKKNL